MQQLSLISFTAAFHFFLTSLHQYSARRFINNDAVWVDVYVRMCKALEFFKQQLVIQAHREQATNEQTRI